MITFDKKDIGPGYEFVINIIDRAVRQCFGDSIVDADDDYAQFLDLSVVDKLAMLDVIEEYADIELDDDRVDKFMSLQSLREVIFMIEDTQNFPTFMDH